MEHGKIDRREFLKASSLIGTGILLSPLLLGDDIGYFKMNLPVHTVFYTDGKEIVSKVILASTTKVKSFTDFVIKNKKKTVYVYDYIQNSRGNFVRASVIDIPSKSILNDKMCFDRKFRPVKFLERSYK